MYRLIALIAVLCLLTGVATAQSAKTTAQLATTTVLQAAKTANMSPYVPAWQPILSGRLHTSQQKDVFVGVSLQTALFTRTYVKSSNTREQTTEPVSDTSSATSGIKVRVVIDKATAAERVAEPGQVYFDKRVQTLTATLGQIFYNCLVTVTLPDGTTTQVLDFGACSVAPESIELTLDTMAAHHFNFVLDDLGSGDHTVTVEAAIELSGTYQNGAWEAKAAIGKGSLTVEEVRLVKGLDITL